MRVLVTGGAGFIGSHVVDRLIAHGHEPVVYDRRFSPWHDDGEIEHRLGEITDVGALADALGDCDAVVHLAAVADVSDVLEAPVIAEEVNARGTMAVLEAARRAEVERMVYASTIWVYSDCAPDVVDEDTPIATPSHLYTSTKLAGELYCKAYAELYGVDCTVLRFGIPYGPRAREAAVVPAFVNKALAGEPLTLAGDGSQFRRFVYVEDLAEGVARSLAPEAANRTYNLASDETVTIREIAEHVQSLVGNTRIEFTPARPGDFGGKEVLSVRARDELGWTAATPFAEGVRRYVSWKTDQAARAGNGRERAGAGGNGSGGNGRAARVAEPAGDAADGEPHPVPAPAGRKVLVLSADIGEGHDGPARAIAREFAEEDPGAQVSVVNGLVAMGGLLTSVMRDGSVVMFRWLPWLFDAQYHLFMRFRPTRWLSRKLLAMLGSRRMRRLVAAHDPDLIVSTYPGCTAVLGELRRSGRLEIPTVSSITDLAGLHFWAHPGIDRHVVTHPESIEEVEAIAGERSVIWGRPPTTESCLHPPSPTDARAELGLPAEGRIVLVSGGGWGIGDLEGAISEALEVPDATVVCLCGRNVKVRKHLRERFGGEPRVRLVGFTERMGEHLAAADVLVHSTAGLTVLEAIIAGTPVISYGFGVGHVKENNRALDRFGLAQVACSREQLGPALGRALEQHPAPDPRFAARRTTAELSLDAGRRAPALAPWRLSLQRAFAVGAGVIVLGFAGLGTGAGYSVLSKPLHLAPATEFQTDAPQVGVMIETPSRTMDGVAADMRSRRLHGSFAVAAPPAGSEIARLEAAGLDVVPSLAKGGALVRWIATKSRLRRAAREMGLGHRFLYVPPDRGFTAGQSLLARSAGGRAVRGQITLAPGGAIGALHPGEIIEIEVPDRVTGSLVLDELRAALRSQGLESVPVTRLSTGGSGVPAAT